MYYPPLEFDAHYHIYNRGVNGQNLFLERRNYPYFLKLYRKYLQLVAQTFAYCLLPNHFHFYIRTYSESEQEARWWFMQENCPGVERDFFGLNSPFTLVKPSRAFNNMFISYTRAINNRMGRTGPLFERPFHRKLVSDLNYSKNLIVYIHQNPEKHRLVTDFRDWPHSSYETLTTKRPTDLTRDEVLAWFDGVDGLLAAHHAPLDNTIEFFDINDG